MMALPVAEKLKPVQDEGERPIRDRSSFRSGATAHGRDMDSGIGASTRVIRIKRQFWPVPGAGHPCWFEAQWWSS